jgi:hypothetical protein
MIPAGLLKADAEAGARMIRTTPTGVIEFGTFDGVVP